MKKLNKQLLTTMNNQIKMIPSQQALEIKERHLDFEKPLVKKIIIIAVEGKIKHLKTPEEKLYWKDVVNELKKL